MFRYRRRSLAVNHAWETSLNARPVGLTHVSAGEKCFDPDVALPLHFISSSAVEELYVC